MPNYCANRLTVTGKFEERQKFVDGVRELVSQEDKSDNEESSLLDFSRIIADPKEADKQFGIPECDPLGCHWHNNYWGTKWNALEVSLKHDKEETVYTFLTAWSPPNEYFMKALAISFPNVELDLRYAERGVKFYGYWTNKKEIKGECWKFQNDDVVSLVDEEGEEYDNKLRPGLELYADLFDMSG